MSAAKTTLTALTDSLAAVKITADSAATNATAALAAVLPTLSSVAYDPETSDHSGWIADFAAGKVVQFLPASNGTKTITDTFFVQTTDKLVLRLGNLAPASGTSSRHIVINDGSADLIEITNGEFATLYRNGSVGWVKLPGIVGGVYPSAPT